MNRLARRRAWLAAAIALASVAVLLAFEAMQSAHDVRLAQRERRTEAESGWQPVVKPGRGTEAGDAPAWRGDEEPEYRGLFGRRATKPGGMQRPPNAGRAFTTGC